MVQSEAAVLDLGPLNHFALPRSCRAAGYEKCNGVRSVRRLVIRRSFVDIPTCRGGSLLNTRLSLCCFHV